MRKFEFVTRFEELCAKGETNTFMKLPERSTESAAGYDFFCPYLHVLGQHQLTLVMTGIKAKMDKDDVLKLYNRSSNPKKKGLFLANGVGIVDADYYDNKDNEGEIGFMFYNFTDELVSLQPGDKIGQGIFEKFNLVEGDEYGKGQNREGGFGSTGE